MISCVIFFFRYIKLSSPNINNVLLLGCVITYTSVFMESLQGQSAILCKVREHHIPGLQIKVHTNRYLYFAFSILTECNTHLSITCNFKSRSAAVKRLHICTAVERAKMHFYIGHC